MSYEREMNIVLITDLKCNPEEEWRPINLDGFKEAYAISNKGRIIKLIGDNRIRAGAILKTTENGLKIKLNYNKVKASISIRKMVEATFPELGKVEINQGYTPVTGLECLLDEVWAKMPEDGFEKLYAISSKGRVVTLKGSNRMRAGTILTPSESMYHNSRTGRYFCVTMSNSDLKLRKTVSVHKMVAKAFVPGYKEGLSVDHINGNRFDNTASNLEWTSIEENTKRAHTTGLINNKGSNSGRSKLMAHQVIEIRQMFAEGVIQADIAKYFKVHPGSIAAIISGKNWGHLK